jgi:hypothetical protein
MTLFIEERYSLHVMMGTHTTAGLDAVMPVNPTHTSTHICRKPQGTAHNTAVSISNCLQSKYIPNYLN